MREGRLTAPKPVGLWGAYVMGLPFLRLERRASADFGCDPVDRRAERNPITKGAGLLAVYSAGLGIPFLLAAFMVEQFSFAVCAVKRHLDSVERVMGVLMVITGIGFLTRAPSPASIWLLENVSGAAKISAKAP